MKGTFAAALLAGACHPSTTPPPEAPRTLSTRPIAGFDRADLVALGFGRAVFFAAGDETLDEVGRAEIGHSGVVTADWAGRDAVYVNGNDRQIVRLDASGVATIDAQPMTAYQLAPPANVDDLEELDWEQLAVDDSGAWYGVCWWGSSNPWTCDRWVWRSLDGKDRREVGGDRGRTWTFANASPAGWSVTEHRTQDGTVDEIDCTDPRGTATRIAAQDIGYGNAIVSHQWVSADPPALLFEVGYVSSEGAIAERFELRDGCGKVRATGLSVMPGPGDLWIGNVEDGRGNARAAIFRGATRIGAMHYGFEVRFRPPPPSGR